MAKPFEFLQACKGILMALIISLILTILLTIVYYFTSIQESLLHSLIVSGLSVLLASFYVAYQAGSKGLIYGLSVGLGFFLLTIIIYFIFYKGNPAIVIVAEKFLVSLLTGVIGGTAGAILKR
jgi:putative membrane protein (TIGR04086 family)